MFNIWISTVVDNLPGCREDVAIDLGHSLSELASHIDAPSRHRLASVHLHATHGPVEQAVDVIFI